MDHHADVRMLADPGRRQEAIRRLAGGVTATELRRARAAPDALAALTAGLRDPHPRVRWWCVQLLDHLGDPRAVAALTAALDDPVARVRRNAAHALGCAACKPAWDGVLPGSALARLRRLAGTDPNAKVRAEARRTLRCRAAPGT